MADAMNGLDGLDHVGSSGGKRDAVTALPLQHERTGASHMPEGRLLADIDASGLDRVTASSTARCTGCQVIPGLP